MRAVTFQSVLYGVATALGLNPQRDLNPARAAMLTEYVNRSVDHCWRFDYWPEWTVTEQRAFRLAYNNATAYPGPAIGAPVEVFFAPTVSYYQALVPTTGNPPAVEVNGAWQVDGAHWAVCEQWFGPQTWFIDGWYWGVGPYPAWQNPPDWQPFTLYAGGTLGLVGTQVRNPNDNQVYQCTVSHTSGAAFDATKFGLLTAFNKYLAANQAGKTPIDEVKRFCRKDPYVFPKTPGELLFRISANGWQLKSSAPALVYVEFRQAPPVFTSALWNGVTTYAAGVLVLSWADGNCYLATAGSTNAEPSVTPAKWQVVPFPRILANAVKRLALAHAYRDQKQNDKADDEQGAGDEELQREHDRTFEGQGQFSTANVVAYGGRS